MTRPRGSKFAWLILPFLVDACAPSDSGAARPPSIEEAAQTTAVTPSPAVPVESPAATAATPASPADPSGDAAPEAPLAQTIALKIKKWTWPFSSATADDALENTMATLTFEGWLELDGFIADPADYPGGAEVRLESQPKILLRSKAADAVFDPKALAAADLALLGDLCRDTFASVTPDFEAADGATAAAGLDLTGFTIAWRSHHAQKTLEDVGLLLLAEGLEARCGLAVTATWDRAAAAVPFVFTFDFAPVLGAAHPADDYRGTDSYEQFSEAIDASLMLLERHAFDWLPANDRWQLVDVPAAAAGAPALKRGVPALNKQAFTVATPAVTGTKCVYHETSALRALAPTATQTVRTPLEHDATLDFTVEALEKAPVPGDGTLAHCADVAYVLDAPNKAVALTYSCETYRKILDDGNCGFRVTVKNPADPINTIAVTAELPAGDAEIKDLRDADGALSVLPSASGNPIGGSDVVLSNFTDVRRKAAVTTAFDLWLAVSLDTYTTYFDGHIGRITYDANDASGADCDGAGGYAMSNQPDRFYWCPGGAMTTDFLQPTPSANAVVYRAMLALHETLHTHGEPHDEDDANIVSCTAAGGTAYSAVIAHNIYHCEEDFCYGLKSLAKAQLKSELEYSVGEGDARLLTGACKAWADDMGISF